MNTLASDKNFWDSKRWFLKNHEAQKKSSDSYKKSMSLEARASYCVGIVRFFSKHNCNESASCICYVYPISKTAGGNVLHLFYSFLHRLHHIHSTSTFICTERDCNKEEGLWSRQPTNTHTLTHSQPPTDTLKHRVQQTRTRNRNLTIIGAAVLQCWC